MDILLVLVVSIAVFVVGYISYGTLLSKKVFNLDDSRKTPAVEMEDGIDFVPTDPKFLAGQHFSAIAAAGPITGPIIAGTLFGWLPTLLWILLGSIFVGGVHDMGSLVASIRNKARSITDTMRLFVSKRVWLLFNLFIFFTLIMVIVAFTDVTTSSFVNVVDLENGTTVGGGAIATSSILYLLLPIVMGFLLRYTKLSLGVATAIFLPLVGVAIWVGPYIPFDLGAILGIEDKASVQKIWNLIVLVYCFVAAIVPVWALLQPRGHLGGYFLYVSLGISFIGILLGAFTGKFNISYPAFTKHLGDEGFWTPMFPMLFITVACGACSGFHALVSSGTTSKQLAKESDAKPIGFGMMLVEGVVAVIALITVMMLSKDDEIIRKSPNFIYASGLGSFMETIGISKAFGISFGLMAFTTFVYDTLDICTRLGRFILEELTGFKNTAGKIVSTLIVGGVPLLLMSITLTNPDGEQVAAWRLFWSVFGASNQLLAALALIGVTVWVRKTSKNPKAWYFTFWPAVFMFIMSVWSLIREIVVRIAKNPQGSEWVIPGIAAIYLILAVWLAVETILTIVSGKDGADAVEAE